jgi:predicted TPR repeat methyltransferase
MSGVEQRLRQAWELRRAGRLDEAEAAALAASKQKPPHPLAFHFLGVVRIDLGRFSEAVWALGRALKLAPELDGAWADLGIAHHRQGHFAEAETAYRRAAQINPAQGLYPGYLGALMLDLNKPSEAKACLLRALELQPGDAHGWFNLGRAFEILGEKTNAQSAFLRCRALDQNDSCGAGLKLAQLGAAPLPSRTPPEAVRHFYAARAANWEKDKGETGAYGGLDLFRRALAASVSPGGKQDILDAGCGTGLSGVALRPLARSLTGLDLSPAMLRLAKARGLYDRLIEDDLMTFLAAGEMFDLIAAAAVLLHFGDLAPVLARMKGALKTDGRIAFTVLTHEGSGAILDETSFFRHGRDHVEASLAGAGFAPLLIEEGVHEFHDGQPVMGLAVAAAPTK